MDHGFTADQVKRIAPNYKGDPKKFDPTKVKSKIGKRAMRDITGKPPPTPPAKPSKLPEVLPPPRKLEAAKAPTPQRNHDILSEAIYAPNIEVTKKTSR